MTETPATLLERLRRPADAEAWRQFVVLYTPLLLTWAGRLCSRSEDAADLVQDVFAILVQKLPEFRYDPNRKFRGWLYTVLLNQWRAANRRPDLPIGDGCLDEVPAPAADPDEHEYRLHVLRRALAMLRPDFEAATWEAFEQTAVQGRSTSEVAASLGLSVNAVYVARSRVLHRLRELVHELLD